MKKKKQTKKDVKPVIKSKQKVKPTKKVKKVKQVEKDFTDEDFDDYGGIEEPLKLKQLKLKVIVDNGKDVVFRDIKTGFSYALGTFYSVDMYGWRNESPGLFKLGIVE